MYGRVYNQDSERLAQHQRAWLRSLRQRVSLQCAACGAPYIKTPIYGKDGPTLHSVLCLPGDVIVALANKENHVPYRNSKLTYLLQV